MKIIATQFTLKYNSFEIALSGCKGENGIHCEGCHSPETWDFNIGKPYLEELPQIIKKINNSGKIIKWIWIYGGEPLDQNINDLHNMLKILNRQANVKILLFTRKEIDEVPLKILNSCDYIKTGFYDINNLSDDYYSCGVKLASINQRIIKVGDIK